MFWVMVLFEMVVEPEEGLLTNIPPPYAEPQPDEVTVFWVMVLFEMVVVIEPEGELSTYIPAPLVVAVLLVMVLFEMVIIEPGKEL